MKASFTKVKTLTLVVFSLLLCGSLFAQPANDDCVDALEVTIGADAATCVPVAGSTVGGTGSTEPAFVCSGSWFMDDIWFKFTTGATIPDNGITVEARYGTETGDVGQAGMGLYASCDVDEIPSVCFSNDPGRTTLISSCEFETNHTYYVRVWSAPGSNTNSGSLRLCVYASEEPLPVETDNVLWGDEPGEGDFDGGINGWTTIDDETNCPDFNLWMWHPRGASLGNSCGNAVSSAPSACNGAMVFSSDAYDNVPGGPCGGGGGDCPASQTGELISPPIDLTPFAAAGVVGISLKFHQTMRQFTSTHIVSYSNDDGATWIDKVVNDEIDVNTGTEGFKKVFLKDADLSATAFRVKFRFEANYYYWIIDDVKLVETEANNLQVAPNGFYAVAPNLVTPTSQLEGYSHLADVNNAGAIEQTNVNLNVTIVDNGTGSTAFTDDLAYDPIPGDSLVENLPFPNYFTPDGSITSYTGTYTITSDSMDFDPSDNVVSYSFSTSESTFAKEAGATGTFNPAASNWDAAEAHSAAYGNYFYVVDGDNWEADSVTFAIGAQDPLLIGQILSIYLYTWDTDTNEDDAIDPDERTRVALALYEITGTETVNDLITVPLTVFPTGAPGPIDLVSNQAYAVMVEYTTIDQTDFIMSSSTAVDYAGMIFRTGLDGLDAARYSPLVGLNDDLTAEPYGTVGFGQNNCPVIRLNLAAIVDTEEPLADENLIQVAPNPADETINVIVDLVEMQDQVNIRIMDINGRMIVDEKYNNFMSDRLEFDVSQLANGAYFLHFISDLGMRTERFIVQH